jgi:hypothetical protein
MPDDSEVEAELRTYQRLFQDQEQQARSLHLLRTAARLMTTMQRFNPYLTGSVLDGSAGRHAEIDIQLFPTAPRTLRSSCSTSASTFRHSLPRTDRAEAVLTLVDDAVANLVIYPRDEERVSFRTRDGRIRERARLDVVNNCWPPTAGPQHERARGA